MLHSKHERKIIHKLTAADANQLTEYISKCKIRRILVSTIDLINNKLFTKPINTANEMHTITIVLTKLSSVSVESFASNIHKHFVFGHFQYNMVD